MILTDPLHMAAAQTNEHVNRSTLVCIYGTWWWLRTNCL